MSASEMRIGQPDLTLNETVGRDVRAESACNLRRFLHGLTRRRAQPRSNGVTCSRIDTITRTIVVDKRIPRHGYTRHACNDSVVLAKNGARRAGRGRESNRGGPMCNSIVAAHLLARPSLTKMHDRWWWLTTVAPIARYHYGGNKTARREGGSAWMIGIITRIGISATRDGPRLSKRFEQWSVVFKITLFKIK